MPLISVISITNSPSYPFTKFWLARDISPEVRLLRRHRYATLEDVSRVWRTIKRYIFWTYERGSFHYDVMVTLILVFIFAAPRLIDFKDQPTDHAGHSVGISYTEAGDQLVYKVDAAIVDAQDEGMVRTNLLRVIEPISGKVSILKTEAIRDSSGRIVAYRAIVQKERRP